MRNVSAGAERGVPLAGCLFSGLGRSDSVLIAITGIHGNFYSNPFYYDMGDALVGKGIDLLYAQTNDAFPRMEVTNARTGRRETIGSWNERFSYTDEDIGAYLELAGSLGYRHIYLAGHSLGANKVIYYLSRHRDPRVERFFLLSPADVSYMTSSVTSEEREQVKCQVGPGTGRGCFPSP